MLGNQFYGHFIYKCVQLNLWWVRAILYCKVVTRIFFLLAFELRAYFKTQIHVHILYNTYVAHKILAKMAVNLYTYLYKMYISRPLTRVYILMDLHLRREHLWSKTVQQQKHWSIIFILHFYRNFSLDVLLHLFSYFLYIFCFHPHFRFYFTLCRSFLLAFIFKYNKNVKTTQGPHRVQQMMVDIKMVLNLTIIKWLKHSNVYINCSRSQ